MSQGTIPKDVWTAGIKEYDISFRSGTINNSFWKENLEKEKKLVLPAVQ